MKKHEYAAVVFKSDNNIEHSHKYIDRKMVKGKWRYTYPHELKGNNAKSSVSDFEQRRLQMKEYSDERRKELMDDYEKRVDEQRKEWDTHQKQMDEIRNEFQNMFTEMSDTIDNMKEIKLHDNSMNAEELMKYNIDAINHNRKSIKKLCSNSMRTMTRIIQKMGSMK